MWTDFAKMDRDKYIRAGVRRPSKNGAQREKVGDGKEGGGRAELERLTGKTITLSPHPPPSSLPPSSPVGRRV